MITARDILTIIPSESAGLPTPTIDSSAPVSEVMHRLAASPTGRLEVIDGNEVLGSIDARSCLAALAKIYVQRDDTATVEAVIPVYAYSASVVTRAVEDAGAAVTDLLTSPEDYDRLRVLVRMRCDDPSAAIRNLERYGYEVIDVRSRSYADMEAFDLRMLELQNYLNI